MAKKLRSKKLAEKVRNALIKAIEATNFAADEFYKYEMELDEEAAEREEAARGN